MAEEENEWAGELGAKPGFQAGPLGLHVETELDDVASLGKHDVLTCPSGPPVLNGPSLRYAIAASVVTALLHSRRRARTSSG